ncbi:ATP-dependent endonuclease [Paenibacillus glucanolyticus]
MLNGFWTLRNQTCCLKISVILVEGLAEQLTMSLFARYLGKDLESNHVSVININGRFFSHFLKLFDKTKQHTIHKPVACITDLDPTIVNYQLFTRNKRGLLSNNTVAQYKPSKSECIHNLFWH